MYPLRLSEAEKTRAGGPAQMHSPLMLVTLIISGPPSADGVGI